MMKNFKNLNSILKIADKFSGSCLKGTTGTKSISISDPNYGLYYYERGTFGSPVNIAFAQEVYSRPLESENYTVLDGIGLWGDKSLMEKNN